MDIELPKEEIKNRTPSELAGVFIDSQETSNNTSGYLKHRLEKKESITSTGRKFEKKITVSSSQKTFESKKQINNYPKIGQTRDQASLSKNSKNSKSPVNRSFTQTMQNIYDEVGRALDVIEISEATDAENSNYNPTLESRRETFWKSVRMNDALNETVKMNSNRKNFYQHLGMPLEMMMTTPNGMVMKDGKLDYLKAQTIRKLSHNMSINSHHNNQISEKNTKTGTTQNTSRFKNEDWEIRSAMAGITKSPETRNLSKPDQEWTPALNNRRRTQTESDLPLNSKQHVRLNKRVHSPRVHRQLQSARSRIITRSVDSFPVYGRNQVQTGRRYERWQPSVRRQNSPPYYNMNHNLQSAETLSMPGNILHMQSSGRRRPSPVILNQLPKNHYLHNREGVQSFSEFSRPQNYLRRQGSEILFKNRNFSPVNSNGYSLQMNQVPSRAQGSSPQRVGIRNASPTWSHSVAGRNYQANGFRQYSKEDMENRLVTLIKKILVFSSKIESLKKKILRQNPSFSAAPLFKEFSSTPDQINLEELYLLFQAFGFNLPSLFVYRIMIYLSGYRLEWIQKSSTELLRNSLNKRNSDFIGTKEYTVTNEGKLASLKRINPRSPNKAQFQGNNRAMNGPHNRNINILQPGKPEKAISFNHFQALFESIKDLQFQEIKDTPIQQDLLMKEIDYHVIRQIIILKNRMIKDMSIIMKNIQPYGSVEIFSYLLEFNSETRNSLHKQGFNKQVNPYPKELPRPQDSIDVELGFNHNKQANPDPSTELKNLQVKKTIKIFGRRLNNELDFTKKKKKRRTAYTNPDFDLEEADDESSYEDNTQANHFQEQSLNNVNRNGIQGKANSGKKSILVYQNTIANFLSFHQVQFIEDDLKYVFKAFGADNSEIDLTSFDRFLASPIWNL